MTEETQVQDRPEQDREAKEAAAKAAEYEFGWHSDIDTEFAPKGLTEDTVKYISAKKKEPEWMLEWRLKAFRLWQGQARLSRDRLPGRLLLRRTDQEARARIARRARSRD